MEYYHDLITEKSWGELTALKKKLDFVLIGGWAVYLYTKTLKSKDIDIIVGFDKLSILRKNYQLYKNDRLYKYEAVKGSIQIDIYLPHFSKIGIPVEVLIKNAKNVEGFNLLDKNYLLALKIYTLSQRSRTPKGSKDFIDVVALMHYGGSSFEEAKILLKKWGLLPSLKVLSDIAKENYEIPELNLNKHTFSKIRRVLIR